VSRVTDDPHRFFPRSDGRMFTADGRVESGCPSGYVSTPSYEQALAEIARLQAREGVVVATGTVTEHGEFLDESNIDDCCLDSLPPSVRGQRVRLRVEKCDE